jgi:hypothetical protein
MSFNAKCDINRGHRHTEGATAAAAGIVAPFVPPTPRRVAMRQNVFHALTAPLGVPSP